MAGLDRSRIGGAAVPCHKMSQRHAQENTESRDDDGDDSGCVPYRDQNHLEKSSAWQQRGQSAHLRGWRWLQML